MKKKGIVLGGGVAGMTAAKELLSSGFAVDVFEAKQYAGGRCFSVEDTKTGDTIDNGQHVFVGAYKHFFDLLKFLDSYKLVFSQESLNIEYFSETGNFRLKAENLPFKLGLLFGLLTFKAIDGNSKMNIIKLLLKMDKLKPFEDTTALQLLLSENQSSVAIKYFWEPVILATMNQTVDNSSAILFLNVIRKVFETSSSGKLFFSRTGLSDLFANFKPKIESDGVSKVHFGTRASRLIASNGRIEKLIDSNGTEHFADYFISTLPPKNLERLLYNSNLDIGINTEFDYSTIISCYLWTDKKIIESDFVGLFDTYSDWLFDKRRIMQTDNIKYPYHYSVTISKADELANQTIEKIQETILSDFAKVGLPTANILHSRLLVDKRATISIDPKSEQKRPPARTSIENLIIAGDWTSTQLPATIEGAAQSGYEAVDIIR